MDIISNYFKLRDEVYNYFGFKEDWTVLPLDDRRNLWWKIDEEFEHVIQEECKQHVQTNSENCHSDLIYKQRFYDKWVYRGEEYTMIMIDTLTDGNKFLAIYDNLKEVK